MIATIKMAVILVVNFPVAAIAALTSPTDRVVYDSVSGPLSTGGLGFANSVEIGQAITLEGNTRQVKQIELWIGANRAHEFHVRFYELDGMGGAPGSLIWESQSQTYPLTPGFFNRKVVPVEVPNVVVPTSFAWVVAPLFPSSGNILVGTSDPPSIGTNLDIWHRGSSSWQTFNFNTGVFGARIVAVPEPNQLWISGIWSAVIFVRRTKLPT